MAAVGSPSWNAIAAAEAARCGQALHGCRGGRPLLGQVVAPGVGLDVLRQPLDLEADACGQVGAPADRRDRVTLRAAERAETGRTCGLRRVAGGQPGRPSVIVDARHVVSGRGRRRADQLGGASQVVEQVAAGQPRLGLQLAQRVGWPQERAEQDRHGRADARLPEALVAVRSGVGHREHEQRRDRDLDVLAAVDAQHHADGEGRRQGDGEGRGRPAGQMDRRDADRDAGDDARHPLEGEADDGERVALQGDQRHQRGEHRRVRGAQPQRDLPGAGGADGDPRGLGSLTPGGGAGG